jgi:hypothetical protein
MATEMKAGTINLSGDPQMTGTTKSTALTHPAFWQADRDSSWYGTLAVLAAGLVVVAGLVFTL